MEAEDMEDTTLNMTADKVAVRQEAKIEEIHESDHEMEAYWLKDMKNEDSNWWYTRAFFQWLWSFWK